MFCEMGLSTDEHTQAFTPGNESAIGIPGGIGDAIAASQNLTVGVPALFGKIRESGPADHTAQDLSYLTGGHVELPKDPLAQQTVDTAAIRAKTAFRVSSSIIGAGISAFRSSRQLRQNRCISSKRSVSV